MKSMSISVESKKLPSRGGRGGQAAQGPLSPSWTILVMVMIYMLMNVAQGQIGSFRRRVCCYHNG